MPKYKVVLEREACIGAATCVVAYPERWEIQEDAKVSIKGGRKENNLEIIEITEEELERMKEAADVCPVKVIHIYDERGRKII